MNENAFFVSGTDTDVGKTVVCAALCQKLSASYWKPVQAGRPTDSDRIRELVDVAVHPEGVILDAPMSPHAAAALQGRRLAVDQFSLPTERPLVVEGAGGLLVPLNEREMIIDLIKHLGLPVLLVARSGLGTLNHSLLSLEALRKRQIPVLGLVLNGPAYLSNRDTLAAHAPIIGELPLLETLSAETLKETTGAWHDFDAAHMASLHTDAGLSASAAGEFGPRS